MLNAAGEIQQLWDLAVKSRQEGDLATALTYFQRLSELQPQRTDVHCELGKIFQQLQQTPLAIQAYRRAIAFNSNQSAWVYERLGKALKQQREDAAAIAAYQEAIGRYGHTPLWICRELGDLYARQQQYQRAIATYQELMRSDPSVAAGTYIKIGNIYTQQDQFFAAKAAYQQARRARASYDVNEVVTCLRQFMTQAESQLDILDNGCDPTGRQLALLAEQTTGKVVGTNICSGFPQATVKYRRANNEFYHMDGQNLSFDDSSFDLVISLNVLEHVPNPAKYLQECYRVMRLNGRGFFNWYPLWSGATGHHVHLDMLSREARRLGLRLPAYSLDGTSIPFWGHLLFSAREMLSFLVEERQYDPALAEWMKDYIYHKQDLNRWFWRDVWRSFQDLDWNIVEVHHRGLMPMNSETLTKLQRKYGVAENFSISGAKIVVQKQ